MENWHLLVVEDDAGGREVATTVLEFYDINVDVAKSAEEGLDMLAQNDYTAAIIDLSLPGMDGWTMLKMIRNDPRTADMPCIATTAYHGANVARQAISAGFTAYFPKPLEPDTFVQDLQRFLS